ncbi:uncharacterized protein B0H64DRAFT_200452 [Chaetomium fimeti]|uniref:Uncharacterized protein n=1 Tax=Chaetomium fimeti TaxID=1854472 RepID=A0AAE0LRD2_9PEZI|nr:hypothetical protein B0H64DRAFT_200452 [Chaetomium fimeti]
MANMLMQLPVWWWWWEIGALCISTICCGLLILFLANIDGMAVSLWSLWIQPSTAIAILAAFTKTSMMVPVVSCISQLKWRHFRTRHRPLSHLDLVDDASRGPWGALVVLFQLPRFSLVISMLALVTIINLGVEPSAQQLLDISARNSTLSNASAEVGIATEFNISDLGTSGAGLTPPSSSLFKFYSTLMSGFNAPPAPNFNCSGESCSWPTFTTLGVCSKFKNVTNEVNSTCTPPSNPEGDRIWRTDCNLTFPSQDSTLPYTMSTSFSNGSMGVGVRIYSPEGYLTTRAYGRGIGGGIRSSLNTTVKIVVAGDKTGMGELPPRTQAYDIALYLCAQKITGLTAIPRQLEPGTVESAPLAKLGEPDPTGQDHYPYAKYVTYSSPLTGHQQYVIHTGSENQLFVELLPDWLNGSSASIRDNGFPNFSPNAVLGDYLYHADLETSFSNLAASLSALVRSGNRPEGNANATVMHGDVFFTEPIFHVRWPWLAVILLELALAGGLLYATVVRSARDPLLKTSAVAFLLHGLRGWDAVEMPEKGSRETLSQLAERMVGRLEHTEDEGWRFVKLEDELDPFQVQAPCLAGRE